MVYVMRIRDMPIKEIYGISTFFISYYIFCVNNMINDFVNMYLDIVEDDWLYPGETKIYHIRENSSNPTNISIAEKRENFYGSPLVLSPFNGSRVGEMNFMDITCRPDEPVYIQYQPHRIDTAAYTGTILHLNGTHRIVYID